MLKHHSEGVSHGVGFKPRTLSISHSEQIGLVSILTRLLAGGYQGGEEVWGLVGMGMEGGSKQR